MEENNPDSEKENIQPGGVDSREGAITPTGDLVVF